MLSSDIGFILDWWFVLFILGIAFLPLTSLLFHKFFDKGYIFSKLIGLALTGYAVFIAGILHITKFGMVSSFIVLVIMAGISFLLLPHKKSILTTLKKSLIIFLFEEILFFSLLFMWAYIHSFQPDIHGLEKYMDFGFINSFLRSDYFPPKDMWFTPLYINYYYFGHLLTALLIKLSDVPSNIAFNLMLSTIFTFCFAQTFSLGANLYAFIKRAGHISKVKVIISGLLTALLTSFAGNLHIIYAFFSPYKTDAPAPFWQLQYLPSSFPNSYWYPNATRYIYHTIHEFPIYSWVVADLHGHVLDIPFVLLTIALLFSFYITHSKHNESHDETETHHHELVHEYSDAKKTGYATILRTIHFKILHIFGISNFEFLFFILIGFLLAIMYMTNAWDGAIYLLLTGLVILSIHWQKLDEYKKTFSDASKPKSRIWLVQWSKNFILSLLLVIFSFSLFTAPYSFFFKPFVSGIGVLCSPEALIKIGKIGPLLFEPNHCQSSHWWELLTLYGFFYFFVLVFIFFSFKIKKHTVTDVFVFLLIILSTALIIIPEFIYVKDIYPAHYRANTMFKLVFQAFIMLSISTGYIIFRLLSSIKYSELSTKYRVLYTFYLLVAATLISLVMTYPYIAIKSYYNDLKTYKGLDGTAYLRTQYTSDYLGIAWLNQAIKGQPVILEAQGDSYTDFARVSANTGLPTVLGWTVHEWLWRGSYDIPSPRIEEIKTMYETTDPAVAKILLQKYKVRYVFIGTMEYQKHPKLDEAKFGKLGMLVFKNGTTKIYRINLQ